MPGPPYGAGRDEPLRHGRRRKRRSHGLKRRSPLACLQPRRRRGANQGTRRRECEPGPPCPHAGSRSRLLLGRLAAPRPPTSASSWRKLSSPWPCSSPDQFDSLTEQRRSKGPGHRATIRPARTGPPEGNPLATPVGLAASNTTRVERRSRARAESRLASAGRTGASGTRQTRSTVSSSVVTTLCQRPSEPGRGTRTRRSRSAPSSAAAARPSSGKPITAHQCPPEDAPASSKSSRLVNPDTRLGQAEVGPDAPEPRGGSGDAAGPRRTVAPSKSPSPGNNPVSSDRTGRTRSAGKGPGTGREPEPGAMPVVEKALGSDGTLARACEAITRVYEHVFDQKRGASTPGRPG